MYGKYLIKHAGSGLYLSVCGSGNTGTDRSVCLLRQINGAKLQIWKVIENPYNNILRHNICSEPDNSYQLGSLNGDCAVNISVNMLRFKHIDDNIVMIAGDDGWLSSDGKASGGSVKWVNRDDNDKNQRWEFIKYDETTEETTGETTDETAEEIIPDGQNIVKSISGGEHWYKIKFNLPGKTNFFLEPKSSGLDVDLYLYESDKTNLIKSTEKGELEYKAIEQAVQAGVYYFIKVKHLSGSGQYYLFSCGGSPGPIDPPDPPDTAELIQDGQNVVKSISASEHWYKIIFIQDGKANFYLEPKVSTLDVDLYLYESNKTNLIKSSLNLAGEIDLIEQQAVQADIYYYIRVKHLLGSGQYLLRCKNYADPPAPIQDDQDIVKSISRGEHWYEIRFDQNGKANFYLEPKVSTLDVDLYLYESDKSTQIDRSLNGAGKIDLIEEQAVKAGVYYYIRVNHCSGSGQYLLRCKNYADFDDKAPIGSASEFKSKYLSLLQQKADEIDVDVNVLGAVILVESGGSGFVEGNLKIRFENHKFVEKAGYEDLFYFNPEIRWLDHKYRTDVNDEWKTVHTGSQSSEYNAFNFAKSLNRDAAFQSISMGLGQIMGSNHPILGYSSAEGMFNNFSKGHTVQINGLVDFIASDYDCLQGLQTKNYEQFASAYNGPGNVEEYVPKLIQAEEDFRNA